jgi:hypothetical protein
MGSAQILSFKITGTGDRFRFDGEGVSALRNQASCAQAARQSIPL